MLDIVIGLPPIIHGTTATSNDVAVLIIGLLAAFVLLAAAIFWVAVKQKRQSRIIEAQQRHELLQPMGGEQPQSHAAEEEKVPLWR